MACIVILIYKGVNMMDILPYNTRCEFCMRRKATRLCDVVVGLWCGHPPKGSSTLNITCDSLICDDCTVIFRSMDICPKCQKKLKQTLI